MDVGVKRDPAFQCSVRLKPQGSLNGLSFFSVGNKFT